jgi:hypothetical protein
MALASCIPSYRCGESVELIHYQSNGSLVYKPGMVCDIHRDGWLVIRLSGACVHEGRRMWTAEPGDLRPRKVTSLQNPVIGEGVDILLEDGCWHPAAFAGFDSAGIAWVLRSGK